MTLDVEATDCLEQFVGRLGLPEWPVFPDPGAVEEGVEFEDRPDLPSLDQPEAMGDEIEGRVATSRGSSSFRVPAVALRGFANTGRPASSRSSFIFAKASFGMKISPRTSSTAGAPAEAGRVRGIDLIVRTFAVMTSPVVPSPRVAA